MANADETNTPPAENPEVSPALLKLLVDLLSDNNRQVIGPEINKRLKPLRDAFTKAREDAQSASTVSAEAKEAAARAVAQLDAIERALNERLAEFTQRSDEQAVEIARGVDALKAELDGLRRTVEVGNVNRPQILGQLQKALVEGMKDETPPTE